MAIHTQSLLPSSPQLFRHQRLQVRLGPGAVVADHLGRADRAQAQAFGQRALAGEAVEEPGREQVAGAGGVDHPLDRIDASDLFCRRDIGWREVARERG